MPQAVPGLPTAGPSQPTAIALAATNSELTQRGRSGSPDTPSPALHVETLAGAGSLPLVTHFPALLHRAGSNAWQRR